MKFKYPLQVFLPIFLAFSIAVSAQVRNWEIILDQYESIILQCKMLKDRMGRGETVSRRELSACVEELKALQSKIQDGSGSMTEQQRLRFERIKGKYSGIDIPSNVADTAPVVNDGSSSKTVAVNPGRPNAKINSQRITDLSLKGCANCYIVPSAGRYKFKADCKGSTKEPLDGLPSSASVLWESFGTDEQISPCDLISDATYSDGYVTFRATGRDGNALIAVRDSSGTIVWSWHIWCCKGYDPDAECQPYAGNSGTMMDRNIGATSNSPGNVRSLGLMFQWGRKDPFPGASSLFGNISAASTVPWPSPVMTTAEPLYMSTVTARPMTYIKSSKIIKKHMKYIEDASWSSFKTVNDPCPAGWRVPEWPSGIWMMALYYTDFRTDDNAVCRWDNSVAGIDLSAAFGTLAPCWYPASGFCNMSGVLKSVGEISGCWTCTEDPHDGWVDISLIIQSDSVSTCQKQRYNMSCALPVRCCKEY